MTPLSQIRQNSTPHDPFSEGKPYHTLVIGYGNTLRGDDAVGYQIAEIIEDMNWVGVNAIACHQLMPELAAAIAQTETVIFVDAAIAPSSADSDVAFTCLNPDETLAFTTHAATPPALLALTRWLYDAAPVAYQLTVPAFNFEMGEPLSPVTHACRSRAIEQLRTLCQEL
jgi:hydrogenase maturation protease